MSAVPPSPTPPTGSSNSSVLLVGTKLNRTAMQPVLQYWKSFDLDSKRLQLDTQGSAIKEDKENSLRSRKKLAETTKTFRKLSDAEKLTGMGGLLRSYQEEIDNLTKRAKFSETAFFSLYKNLYAAPDPVPCLEAILDPKWMEIEEENRTLKRELVEYEREFSSLKNQDITIRKLEDQVSTLEHQMEEMILQQVEEKSQHLEEQLATKANEMIQQKQEYERQLEQTRQELRDAFTRMDAMQSDLLAHKQRTNLAKSSLEAEMDLFSQEKLMIQTLQLENTQLKQQLEDLLSINNDNNTGLHSSNSSNSSNSSSSYSSNINSSSNRSSDEATIVALRQELFQIKAQLSTMKEEMTMEKQKQEEKCLEMKKNKQILEKELEKRPSVEKFHEILHQLRIFQQLEYNIIDEEAIANAENNAGETLSAIEKMLVSRVRRLENALRQQEIAVEKRTVELERAQEELERKSVVIQDQVLLLRQLEENVATLESRKSSVVSSNHTHLSNSISTDILMEAMDGSSSATTSSTDENGGSASSGAAGEASSSSGETGNNKMFEIVRGQRDRFRDRMKELESEKNKVEEVANACKASMTRLEQDNMQLYQKIRYLQSYRQNNNNNKTAGMRVSPQDFGTSIEDGHGSGGSMNVENRYENMYEEKMNPFAQFNKMETQQRYSNLNTVDKILLNSAKMFLGHRITRTFAFVYILLLHFLVFATLWAFMHGCHVTNNN